MRRRREKDGISLKKKDLFLFLDTDFCEYRTQIN
jgi:hypothetical protein